MYRQLIIIREDLNMSNGKLAAQVSHASMAFLINTIKNNVEKVNESYQAKFPIPTDVYEEWMSGEFKKIVLKAKNKTKLLNAISIAKAFDLFPNRDVFPIFDNCHTELIPEEENGTTLTCIGFVPLPDDVAAQISRKYRLL